MIVPTILLICLVQLFACVSGAQLTCALKLPQGDLRGEVVMPNHLKLQKVEKYLGIPYASPPVGSQRFMPPGSPPTWEGEKIASKFGPVCPQNLPISDDTVASWNMSLGRYKYLKRILPFLQQQDEDCLYLNIYAPAREGCRTVRKHPVIVFIHGESYEWNSGNPYDGTVLSSYGQVVVVTLNFRLGILGFLRPGVRENTVTNFALLDQIAALNWIKENIEVFGGDPNSVTLMGHGTGAACVNLLLVSPVSQVPVSGGLFHRAILMSGTALSDWALTSNPVKYSIQVAEALNCPLMDKEERMARCLRLKRLSEIMSIQVEAPPFKTPFGPVVDGSVVPNEPNQVMGVYKDLFSRYDLLYGITEIESYHLLDGVSLEHGMLETEFNDKLLAYVKSRFEIQPREMFATILKHYTNWRKNFEAENRRDTFLEILSDAQVAAPMIQTAEYHSVTNPKSYFYVFTHKPKFDDFPKAETSIHGQVLPYVFGSPVDGGHYHLKQKTDPEEALISEAIMHFWTNFAKTGDPNAPSRHNFLSPNLIDYNKYLVEWLPYDVRNQSFLRLDTPPRVQQYYRKQSMEFWNKVLPDISKNPTIAKSNIPNFSNTRRPPTSSIYPLPSQIPPPWIKYHPGPPTAPYEPTKIIKDLLTPYKPMIPERTDATDISKEKPGMMDGPSDAKREEAEVSLPTVHHGESSVALSIVIVVGICFLVVNLCAFAGIYYQRDKLKLQERLLQKKYKAAGDDEEHYNEVIAKEKLANKKVNTLEKASAVRCPGTIEEEEDEEQRRRRWLARQCSISTLDPQTKVRDWIAQDFIQKYSPKIFRRPDPKVPKEEASTDTSLDKVSVTTIQKKPAKTGKKVSIAVDATPGGRQKEKSQSKEILNEQKEQKPFLPEVENVRVESAVPEKSQQGLDAVKQELRRSSTTINIIPKVPQEPAVIIENRAPMQTFSNAKTLNMQASSTDNLDVNVTSRDETASSAEERHGDALTSIKKLNYPKVLPELPASQAKEQMSPAKAAAAKRRSLQLQPQQLILPNSTHSLGRGSTSQPTTPTHKVMQDSQTQTFSSGIPPAPPPRGTSTLRRHQSASGAEVPQDTKRTLPRSKGQEGKPKNEPSRIEKAQPRVIIKPTISKKPTQRQQSVDHARISQNIVNVSEPTSPTKSAAGTPHKPAPAKSDEGDHSSGSTGTIKRSERTKKPNPSHPKDWYVQYNQSFLSKPVDES